MNFKKFDGFAFDCEKQDLEERLYHTLQQETSQLDLLKYLVSNFENRNFMAFYDSPQTQMLQHDLLASKMNLFSQF